MACGPRTSERSLKTAGGRRWRVENQVTEGERVHSGLVAPLDLFASRSGQFSFHYVKFTPTMGEEIRLGNTCFG